LFEFVCLFPDNKHMLVAGGFICYGLSLALPTVEELSWIKFLKLQATTYPYEMPGQESEC